VKLNEGDMGGCGEGWVRLQYGDFREDAGGENRWTGDLGGLGEYGYWWRWEGQWGSVGGRGGVNVGMGEGRSNVGSFGLQGFEMSKGGWAKDTRREVNWKSNGRKGGERGEG